MKDTLILSLPYPVKFLGLTISRPRKIGFLFTNLSMFLFRENNDLKTSDDYKKWAAQYGENRLISEMIYAAGQAYCMTFGVKQNYTKSLLTVAIAASEEEQQLQLIQAFQRSQTFGVKSEKKKNLKS